MNGILSWADHRVLKGPGEALLFSVDDAGLFSLTPEAHDTLRRWRTSRFVELDKADGQDLSVLQSLREVNVLRPANRDPGLARQPAADPAPLSTLVLEVAQDCNLRCSYCYAESGNYGAVPCLMDPAMARRGVRYLLEHSAGREDVTLIFFGGEPLLNMEAVKAATEEAHELGGKMGKRVHFSLTTNGTLLNPGIVDFLHKNRIAVAVSMDGPAHIHDRNRPDATGRGSYAEVVSNLAVLLEDTPVPVAARVTLVPDQWHQAEEVFDHLIGLGFHEAGIAPVSPVFKALLPSAAHEAALLKSFARLARRFVDDAKRGLILPFSNLLDLLGRLHLGQTRTVSCGAGFGYMAADAKGRLFPCHRLAGEPDFCVGNLLGGVDNERKKSCLRSLNGDRKESCSKCWARTLCAGGCHYENHLRENQLGLPRGTSCRFIRSWLDLGMRTYAELRSDGAMDAMNPRLTQRAQC